MPGGSPTDFTGIVMGASKTAGWLDAGWRRGDVGTAHEPGGCTDGTHAATLEAMMPRTGHVQEVCVYRKPITCYALEQRSTEGTRLASPVWCRHAASGESAAFVQSLSDVSPAQMAGTNGFTPRSIYFYVPSGDHTVTSDCFAQWRPSCRRRDRPCPFGDGGRDRAAAMWWMLLRVWWGWVDRATTAPQIPQAPIQCPADWRRNVWSSGRVGQVSI